MSTDSSKVSINEPHLYLRTGDPGFQDLGPGTLDLKSQDPGTRILGTITKKPRTQDPDLSVYKIFKMFNLNFSNF